MDDMLALPPGFGVLPCGNDPWAAAMHGAAKGDDPGSIRWDYLDGVLRLAIVLAPDRPMQDAGPVAGLGALALFDAVATLAPPQVPIHLLARDGLAPDGLAPDGLAVDGGRVATIRAALTPALPGEVPDWAVLGFEIALQASTAEPGATPERTSLHEEGFGDVTAADVLVNTLRHLLVWLDAWGQDGAAALAPATLQRMTRQAVPA